MELCRGYSLHSNSGEIECSVRVPYVLLLLPESRLTVFEDGAFLDWCGRSRPHIHSTTILNSHVPVSNINLSIPFLKTSQPTPVSSSPRS